MYFVFFQLSQNLCILHFQFVCLVFFRVLYFKFGNELHALEFVYAHNLYFKFRICVLGIFRICTLFKLSAKNTGGTSGRFGI